MNKITRISTMDSTAHATNHLFILECVLYSVVVKLKMWWKQASENNLGKLNTRFLLRIRNICYDAWITYASMVNKTIVEPTVSV